MARSLDNLGNVAHDRGEYARATNLRERALALSRQAGDRRATAAILTNLGVLATYRQDWEGAERLLVEALALFREVGDGVQVGLVLNNLGHLAMERRQTAGALGYFEEALAVAREFGDRQGVGWALLNCGEVRRLQGDLQGAERDLTTALTILREIGNRRPYAFTLATLSAVARARGEPALPLLREALIVSHEVDDKASIARILVDLADLVATSVPETAARLLGAAAGLREALGTPAADTGAEAGAQRCRRRLGAERFAGAWELGRTRPLAATIAEVAALGDETATPGPAARAELAAARDRPAGPLAGLTPREVEVLRLMAAGRADKEIAAALAISRHTAGHHVRHILAKLELDSRAAAAAHAVRAGLI
jgi:non-specific serine/threonine protein kinase